MIEFQAAAPGQIDDVLSVLNEAADWLRARGIGQWPERFDPAWVDGAIDRGETWLVRVDGALSGTVTLDLADPIWSDVGGTAVYVHRMAVRRAAAGLGAVILAWAADAARQRGGQALRLDCVAFNPRLRAYYEAAGFVHRGDVTVAGAPGQRLDTGPTVLVSRYELPLQTDSTALSGTGGGASPQVTVTPAGGLSHVWTLTRTSHALMTPPTRLARTAGISQYRPPPDFTRKVSPASPTSRAVMLLGDARSI